MNLKEESINYAPCRVLTPHCPALKVVSITHWPCRVLELHCPALKVVSITHWPCRVLELHSPGLKEASIKRGSYRVFILYCPALKEGSVNYGFCRMPTSYCQAFKAVSRCKSLPRSTPYNYRQEICLKRQSSYSRLIYTDSSVRYSNHKSILDSKRCLVLETLPSTQCIIQYSRH